MLDVLSNLQACLFTTSCVYSPFILSVGLAFLFAVIGAFGFLFSISLRNLLFFHALLTAGILMNFVNTGLFFADSNGMILAGFILMTVFCEISAELILLKYSFHKISPLFYGLPFASFILMAISRDLLSLFVALEGFQLSFFILFIEKTKNRNDSLILLKEGLLSLATFAWGISILYIVSGNITLSAVQKIITQPSQVENLALTAVFMMFLAIIIKLRLFFSAIQKIKKHA